MEGTLLSTLERWFTEEALERGDHPGVEYVRRRWLSDDPEIVAQYWEAMAEHDLHVELRTVRVPVTVLAGTRDQASPVAAAQEMARSLLVSRLRTCAGPHLVHLECPVDFAREVSKHLEWVDTVEGPMDKGSEVMGGLSEGAASSGSPWRDA